MPSGSDKSRPVQSIFAAFPFPPPKVGDSRPAVAVVNQSPEDEARSLIQRLIDQDSTIPNIDAELWAADLDGGSIVQVATLARSADRADVAVSIAFVTAVAGEPAEPIGIRVRLHASDGNWIVDGIGYL